MSKQKPLFIPLKTAYYQAFKNGTKTVEYRVAGGRWNANTCSIGRRVTLSKGYGKAHRLEGVIVSYEESMEPCASDAWKDCYGEGTGPAACIGIEVTR